MCKIHSKKIQQLLCPNAKVLITLRQQLAVKDSKIDYEIRILILKMLNGGNLKLPTGYKAVKFIPLEIADTVP